MYCRYCGTQISDSAQFCHKCGRAVKPAAGDTTRPIFQSPFDNNDKSPSFAHSQAGETPPVSEPDASSASTKTKRQRLILIIGCALLVVGLVVAGIFLLLTPESEKTPSFAELSLEELLQAAEQALYEGNYEEAILAYESALEIDPKVEDAYLGLAQAYSKSGVPEKAAQTLSDGVLLMRDSTALRSALGEYLDETEILRLIAEKYGEELTVTITQIDTSQFPLIRVYLDARNAQGEAPDDLESGFFYLSERLANDGSYVRRAVDNVLQLDGTEQININLVADVSGSMDGNPLYRVKEIMRSFMNTVQFSIGDMVELLSFDETLHMENRFTNDKSEVLRHIDALTAYGGTALYDALVGALYSTASQNGAKVIIAFTDGMDNSSTYTPDDVVQLSDTYKIPIFIVGIGNELELNDLAYIVDSSGGFFRNIANVDDGLQEIYQAIFTLEKEQYVLEYTTDGTNDDTDIYMDIVVDLVSEEYTGTSTSFVYEPQAHYSFYNGLLLPNGDWDPELFILELNKRYISAAELDQFSYEQIRYIRNGLYALSGKTFEKQQFIDYFNSKTWYSPYTYYVQDDPVVVARFNEYQKANWNVVIAYEKVRGWR